MSPWPVHIHRYPWIKGQRNANYCFHGSSKVGETYLTKSITNFIATVTRKLPIVFEESSQRKCMRDWWTCWLNSSFCSSKLHQVGGHQAFSKKEGTYFQVCIEVIVSVYYTAWHQSRMMHISLNVGCASNGIGK